MWETSSSASSITTPTTPTHSSGTKSSWSTETGAVIPSLTSLTSVTDIITDPNGRILLADFGPNFDNGYNPQSGGIFELTSVPEPSTLALLLVAAPVALVVVWRGRHARRCG
jgi:hypothetical protein